MPKISLFARLAALGAAATVTLLVTAAIADYGLPAPNGAVQLAKTSSATVVK
jgi:hypothetical protein